MKIVSKNIYKNLPGNLHNEIFQVITENSNVKIEKIISNGQSSPPNFWYNQELNEFVILLKGSAELLFENDEYVKMIPGDYIIIPSHKKHRVERTSETEETIWLAIHY